MLKKVQKKKNMDRKGAKKSFKKNVDRKSALKSKTKQ